jgi:N-6 DNA Methylase
MDQLSTHNQSLRYLIDNSTQESIASIVDLDSIDTVLRQCLPLDQMREAGSFFTGQNLATKVINSFEKAITSNSRVLDPTCGAGNLLIECSRKLGVHETLSETLAEWGNVLWGYDIHESFIEASKLRLIIDALNRGVQKDCSVEQAMSYFKNIKVKDALLVTKKDLIDITHVVMNPPFSIWKSPNKNYWKQGKVNAAGIVFDLFLRNLPKECVVVAILPEVLRSGSRYNLFRNFCSITMCAKCIPWGRFNIKTDVDVFILAGVITDFDTTNSIMWQDELGVYQSLSSKFNVCIGPLVAYRDIQVGSEYPYFHSKNTPGWEIIEDFRETRKFQGKVISPPFILIKRTSSPSDRYRATATIINLKSMVAVENHLIVIKPKNNSLVECKKLLKVLRAEKTNEFLNKRIRLRHLTVQAIKDIPIN